MFRWAALLTVRYVVKTGLVALLCVELYVCLYLCFVYHAFTVYILTFKPHVKIYLYFFARLDRKQFYVLQKFPELFYGYVMLYRLRFRPRGVLLQDKVIRVR